MRSLGIYRKIFATLYDRFMASTEAAGLRDMRTKLLAEASGTVLEIGAGTGANASLYGEKLEKLIFAEPEKEMIKRLKSSTADLKFDHEILHAKAESLPLPDMSVDTVVSTLVLCTVDSPSDSLTEIARVLKPGGKFLFIEHVLSDDRRLAKWQNRLNRLWNKFGAGCNCNRRTLDRIEKSPLTVVGAVKGTLPKAIPLVRPSVIGTAVR